MNSCFNYKRIIYLIGLTVLFAVPQSTLAQKSPISIKARLTKKGVFKAVIRPKHNLVSGCIAHLYGANSKNKLSNTYSEARKIISGTLGIKGTKLKLKTPALQKRTQAKIFFQVRIVCNDQNEQLSRITKMRGKRRAKRLNPVDSDEFLDHIAEKLPPSDITDDTTCNGIDDDSDGEIDEDFEITACGIGACSSRSSCIDGTESSCIPGTPAASDNTCDGVDDDCDGSTDEDYSPTSCGVGACASTSSCSNGNETSCTPGSPTTEICDSIDNDCDGQIDEGCIDECDDTDTDDPADLETAIEQGLVDKPGSGSGDYNDTDDQNAVSDLQSSLSSFLNSDFASAKTSATSAGYELCETSDGYAVWREPVANAGTNKGFALLALRYPDPDATADSGDEPRSVIITGPHPHFETNIKVLTREIFEDSNLKPAALALAGTHRCSNADCSGCQGKTSVCGASSGTGCLNASSEKFRESDQAHITDGTFHEIITFLDTHFSSDDDRITFSIHGKGNNGVMLSNGTDEDTTSTSRVSKLAEDLACEFEEVADSCIPNTSDAIVTCNDYTGIPSGVCNEDNKDSCGSGVGSMLCGTTNTQGRAINEADSNNVGCSTTNTCTGENACFEATSANHFIHLELELAIRTSSANRAKVLNSIKSLFGL